jgi:hypothetical protein
VWSRHPLLQGAELSDRLLAFKPQSHLYNVVLTVACPVSILGVVDVETRTLGRFGIESVSAPEKAD